MSKLNELSDDIINQRICLKILLLTGIRNAELHGLRWSDVDLENKILHIRRNRLYCKEFGIYEKKPKTKTSMRDIPMPNNLIDDLRKYQEWFRLADEHLTKSKTNTILPLDLTGNRYIRKRWDVGLLNLKQRMDLNTFLVMD